MSTLFSYRRQLAAWWLGVREEFGRRVAKSKRREIAELRGRVARLTAQVAFIEASMKLAEAAASADGGRRSRHLASVTELLRPGCE